MEIIFLLFTFLILIINLNGILAIGFSPGVLNYELDINQKVCKIITINSESQTMIISDKWAENKDIGWVSSKFDKTADFHGLGIDYPKEIKSEDKKFEVCISGQYPGQYQGSMTIQEEQTGNAIMQGGVWLNVTITDANGGSEEPQEVQQDENIIRTTTPITGAVIGALKQNTGKIITGFILIVIIAYITILIHRKTKKFDEFNI